MISAFAYAMINDYVLKTTVNVLVFYVLSSIVYILFKTVKRYDRTIFLFILDTVKFVLLGAILRLFTNPMKTENQIPAILYCGNYFIFQAALIVSTSKVKR